MENLLQKENPQSNQTLIDTIMELADMDIKIGVSEAEDEAREESAKRRISSPPTIEEDIFLLSSQC